jgi:hypothetical protein
MVAAVRVISFIIFCCNLVFVFVFPSRHRLNPPRVYFNSCDEVDDDTPKDNNNNIVTVTICYCRCYCCYARLNTTDAVAEKTFDHGRTSIRAGFRDDVSVHFLFGETTYL